MIGTIALKIIALLSGGSLQDAVAKVTDAYKARLQNGTDLEKISADLAARQLQLDARDAELQATLTNQERWYSPRAIMGYAIAFYLTKIFVWDKCLHLGVTDPIDENLRWVLQTVVIAYCGARAIRDLGLSIRK